MPEPEGSAKPTSPVNPAGIRSLWFGMRCDFTREAITGALEEDSSTVPTAIVLPRSPGSAQTGWPKPPFDRWLEERDIVVVEVDDVSGAWLEKVLDIIRNRQMTLAVGACFPMKIPSILRDALEYGVLNIHPSLLPKLRGPDPVAHAYRLGLEETGVTIHLMDDGWDSGPILAQQRVRIPQDRTAAQLEADLARIGGRMVGSLARPWVTESVHATIQHEEHATWASGDGDV